MDIFIRAPLLAVVPLGGFLWQFVRTRSPAAGLAALGWGVYLPYEYGMKLRLLCSGECNIRVDLLLIYPVLAFLSLLALCAPLREILFKR